jgi:hypothetical protein
VRSGPQSKRSPSRLPQRHPNSGCGHLNGGRSIAHLPEGQALTESLAICTYLDRVGLASHPPPIVAALFAIAGRKRVNKAMNKQGKTFVRETETFLNDCAEFPGLEEMTRELLDSIKAFLKTKHASWQGVINVARQAGY